MHTYQDTLPCLRNPQPWLVLAAVLALWGLRLCAQTGGGFDLSWSRAGGGTVSTAAGGGFELSAAVGQPTAGWRASDAGELVLVDGFGALYAVQAFSLELRLGWNLISVPLYPLNPEMAEVLPAGVRGPLWGFAAGGYQPVLSLEPMQGYWVWSGRAGTRVVQGVPVEEPVRSLAVGWSLVGPTGLPPYAALELPLVSAPAGALAGPAWGWSPAFADYRRAGTSLPLGGACWVYAGAPATVRLGP
jgi:hypothetical protein